MTKTIILGAGIAGLELGRRLNAAGNRDFLVLEKESQVGGLCRTNKTGDYYWDFAVHALYSRDKQVADYLRSLLVEYASHLRNAKIFHTSYRNKQYILDYPFEIGIRDLPLREKYECLSGHMAAWFRKTRYTNLQEWIDTFLGSGIAKHFMVPYNRKIWNASLNRISPSLVCSKIEPMAFKDFLSNIFGKRIVGRQYQSSFIYPNSGIQALADYMAADIRDRIMLNMRVTGIKKNGTGGWRIVSDQGSEFQAQKIVSTMPLAELLQIVEVDGLSRHYDGLKWNDTFFVMVGLKKGASFRIIDKCHWVFFKEEEIFYRLTVMNNFSPLFPCSLVAEITRKGENASRAPSQIVNSVVKDLLRIGIIGNEQDIASTDIKLVNYTYPIPTIGLDKLKEEISGRLKNERIWLLGRSGAWEYLNVDGVMVAVKEFLENNPL